MTERSEHYGRDLVDRVEELERSVLRIQIVSEFRGEDYFTKLVDSRIKIALSEYNFNERQSGRADAGLRTGYIALGISLIMFLITLIGIISQGVPSV